MRAIIGACAIGMWLSGCGPADSSGAPDGPTETDTDNDGVVDTDGSVPCDGVTGEGYGEGDISMDWTLNDKNGNPVSLYDYCGRVIYIEDTTAW